MTTVRAWRAFWAIALTSLIIGFTKLDVAREQDDIAHGRTHSTGTTLSSSIRWWIECLGWPGLVGFLGITWGLPAWLTPHILRHLDRRRARW